jgi:hypothetical protein
MPLDRGDDLATHEKTPARAWRESYYCNFFDFDSGLHGCAWSGVRPNAERGESLFALFDGSECLIRHIDFEVPVAADIGEERRQTGPLSFTPVEPWNHWQVTFDDGSSRVEIDWRQFSEICDWDWEDLTRSRHFQAAGRVQVEGQVGDRKLSFEGTGERDRAWGERDHVEWTFVWWFVVQFDDETAAHVMLIRDREGVDRLHGYLHQDGVSHGIATYDAQIEYAAGEGPPIAGTHQFVDTAGRELTLTAMEPLHEFSFSADGDFVEDRPPEDGDEHGRMFWTFHRFVRADGAVGRGMIDYVFWSGNQPAEISCKGPARSTMYDYGLTEEAR